MEKATQRKLVLVKAAAKKREEAIVKQQVFPSWFSMMSEAERQFISGAQSRAMRSWWTSLSAKQREEMSRRIKEGRYRAATHKIQKAA